MIIPCIDLMDGKVVQLRQGREKVLEGKSPDEMLQMFTGFPEIQVIDLDAAMGKGFNSEIVKHVAAQARTRVGGGVRTPARAIELVQQGADRVIVGTAAFSTSGPNIPLLESMVEAVGAACLMLALDTKGGHIVVKGWQEATSLTAEEVIGNLEPYCSAFLCTYVDKEGMMQGTDINWFQRLRQATNHEITAAGGITTMQDVEALTALHIDCAIGMSIYTGRLSLDGLRQFNVTRNTV